MLKKNNKGSLIVISGPSGSGKDSIVNELKNINDKFWVSISCTSRDIRPGEKEGENYFFLTKEEFENKIENDEFLEYAKYNENYYGTPKSVIQEKLDQGIDVILIIEVQGALIIKEKVKEAIFIFIMPPNMKELKTRLINRKTEDMEKINKRFKIAYNEINEFNKYNYVVVNDDLKEATNKVNAILISEKCRADRIEEVNLSNEEEFIHESLINKEFVNEDSIID